jgi:hypothetical protein
MPRVTGDSCRPTGSAWLAAEPPAWLTSTPPSWLEPPAWPSQEDAVLTTLPRPRVPLVHATLTHSSTLLRWLTRTPAA